MMLPEVSIWMSVGSQLAAEKHLAPLVSTAWQSLGLWSDVSLSSASWCLLGSHQWHLLPLSCLLSVGGPEQCHVAGERQEPIPQYHGDHQEPFLGSLG